MLVPVVRSYCFMIHLDKNIRGGLGNSMRSGVKGEGDVGEKGVSHDYGCRGGAIVAVSASRHQPSLSLGSYSVFLKALSRFHKYGLP